MEKFTPSINWGHELVASLLWILQAWAVSGACLLVVAVLVVRFTRWGSQFWRITGEYYTGRHSVPVWGLFGALLLSVITSVRLTVLFTYYSNDLYSALQAAFQGAAAGNDAVRDSGIHGFWVAIWTFCVIATLQVIQVMTDLYVTQRFLIRWRVWLTDRLTADWLGGRAYYRGRFLDTTIDNPDQRIQQDIDIFTAGVGGAPNSPSVGTSATLLFGAVRSVVSVVSFAAILWRLSGTLTVFGIDIPKALFWVLFAYVSMATVVAFWIGHPLIRFSFRNELFNAAFRYALVRLRDAAEAIGFYRGERVERSQLAIRFADTIANYRRYVRRTIGFLGWNVTMSQTINPLPFIVQAPRLFAGSIKLGDVIQSAGAFGQIEDSLSFFRNAYDRFASYRAAIMRLNGLAEANARARRLPELRTAATGDIAIELDDVEVRSPTGTQLIEPLNVRLVPGDALVITGKSGCGKTSLLRTLAGLWPYASGTLRYPDGRDGVMFVPQLPYLPLGNLRAGVSYPAMEGEIDDLTLRDALAKVTLPNLVSRLDDVEDWAKVLSPGEQQRIAFARVLVTRPKAVFLDEATSALDEGLEFALYDLLRRELPDCIVVSASHRSTVEPHHHQELELLGNGPWRLSRIGEPVASM
ncbi:ABC transporter ATP-binding protein/permease [Mycobacterium kansasii]|uniref:Vitamin B12 transport ATP-binding protein BacA n=2 Tax=Mycobacterium kansasii TaxID=1768 RepID=A0A653EKL8_MYCKA|nr:ABC transporter ATP-binding protein/permease [Mycobacterium kansasii]AGZ51203.1 multidrug ABC transporter ATP-binding protein [Mycobacterium kansasii ATCC 12478]ARG57031.1 multidrug ABC transporter ATP-binding protein [Mycobacterium kansasii]ARG62549.1 multidrug ABC transporter ATP-binding protein [Mycobacterium kansasii]ARG70171.1 multidrug ABC transporter ATP-binding protein [Mycobacterium kansasii]ARG75219.1 multidrug ABC transporter ATP-binding protein [Mycobacterium kansasii]